MSIAILYICTGHYNIFFNGFYASCEKFFLPEAKKTYFVWTDDAHLADGLANVILYPKKCAGFPADSLFRFEMFLQAEDELKKYDYIYFFNANAEIRRLVGEEILPDETGLAMSIWPGRREAQHPMFYPYERNKKSLAYIAPFKHFYYYAGGFLNGGTSDAYLKMIKTLSYNIRDDYKRGIVAKVHDESHINAYLRYHPCKQLRGREICLPEEWIRSGEQPKIVLRDKVKIDPYFNKGRKSGIIAKLKKGISMIWNAVRWYLYI